MLVATGIGSCSWREGVSGPSGRTALGEARVVGPEARRRSDTLVGRTRLKPGCGHFLPEECAGAAIERILALAAKTSSAPGSTKTNTANSSPHGARPYEMKAGIHQARGRTNDGAGRISGFVVPESCPKIPAADFRLCPTEVAGRAEARHLGAALDVVTC
jgi:hypothetical protein